MEASFDLAIPVLPAVDVAASLKWWTEICGFTEVFRHGDPASYGGLSRGPVSLHITSVEGRGFDAIDPGGVCVSFNGA